MTRPRAVKWSQAAADDLNDIASYISRDNPEAAGSFIEYVVETTHNLALSPIGRPGAKEGTTEKVLSRYPHYILIFTYDKSHLRILRLFHAAQSRTRLR